MFWYNKKNIQLTATNNKVIFHFHYFMTYCNFSSFLANGRRVFLLFSSRVISLKLFLHSFVYAFYRFIHVKLWDTLLISMVFINIIRWSFHVNCDIHFLLKSMSIIYFKNNNGDENVSCSCSHQLCWNKWM